MALGPAPFLCQPSGSQSPVVTKWIRAVGRRSQGWSGVWCRQLLTDLISASEPGDPEAFLGTAGGSGRQGWVALGGQEPRQAELLAGSSGRTPSPPPCHRMLACGLLPVSDLGVPSIAKYHGFQFFFGGTGI
jgi:hypothetical protein